MPELLMPEPFALIALLLMCSLLIRLLLDSDDDNSGGGLHDRINHPTMLLTHILVDGLCVAGRLDSTEDRLDATSNVGNGLRGLCINRQITVQQGRRDQRSRFHHMEIGGGGH